MRFQTPQFIEVEDKIFGPFTLRQFIYLAGGGGLSFIIWTFAPFRIFAIVLILPVIALTLALTFYRINNRPFINVVESAFHYATNNRLYIWKKEPKKITRKKQAATETNDLYVPKLSDSKLKDLAWSLDVHDTTRQSTR